MATDNATTPDLVAQQRSSEADIAQLIRAATPWVLDVELRPAVDGGDAELMLDANMAKARAEQQGLADPSLAAAERDANLRNALSRYVERVNASLPPEQRIVSHRIRRTASTRADPRVSR